MRKVPLPVLITSIQSRHERKFSTFIAAKSPSIYILHVIIILSTLSGVEQHDHIIRPYAAILLNTK